MRSAAQVSIPDLKSHRVVVTGATSGIGFEAAKQLGQAGAHVVLVVRNRQKANHAMKRLLTAVPRGNFSVQLTELSDPDSIIDAASRFRRDGNPIDLLINNAGVMNPPQRQINSAGMEMQFAANYLSHFALTGLLLPLLRKATHPRVVSVSSLTARMGRINFDDLSWTKRYAPGPAYAQSKLAMLLFAGELQRRSVRLGWGLTSLAAHPGWTRTQLGSAGSYRWGSRLNLVAEPEQGAQPIIMAATAPEALGGQYYGPTGRLGCVGPPGPVSMPKKATNAALGARLWEVSEELTSVHYPKQPS